MMKYTPRKAESRDAADQLYRTLEPVAKGLGLVILELSLFRQKGRSGMPGSVQVRVTVYKDGNVGVDDCSRFHKAIMPRLELAFEGSDVYVEVSSPGISRLIKDGSEMVHYIGRNIKCYCSDEKTGEVPDLPSGASGWIEGTLEFADENGITVETEGQKIVFPYGKIAKAKLAEV